MGALAGDGGGCECGCGRGLCRDRALAAIKLAPEDVALVVQELDVPTDEASRRLREAGGDVYVDLFQSVHLCPQCCLHMCMWIRRVGPCVWEPLLMGGGGRGVRV